MQSSIAPDPRTKSPRALLARLAGLIFAVVLATEIFWRVLGYGPAGDELQRWLDNRERVKNNSNAIALIGSSRILFGLDPEVLDAELPGYRTYSLALSGWDPMPILEDLANDPAFRGTVVCENIESQGFERYPFKKTPPRLQWVQLPLPIGTKRLVQSVRSQITLQSNSLWLLLAPVPAYSSADQNNSRFTPLRFTSHEAALHRSANRRRLVERYQAWKQQPPYPAEQSVLAQIPKWVAQIRSRGGDVIFVRMPTAGEIARLDQAFFGQCRRQFASSFHPYVDCDSDPVLKALSMSDESHLDADAAHTFSQAFARILRERDLIGRSGSTTARR